MEDSLLKDFLIIPLIKTGIGVILGLAITFIGLSLPSRFRWRLKEPKTVKFIIATSSVVNTGTYLKKTTGMGQVMAIGRLFASFFRAYSNKIDPQILFSKNLDKNQLQYDTVIIGGVKNNEITKLYLEKMKDILPYTQKTINNTDVIIDRRRHTNLYGVHSAGEIKEDFGLIISAPNPFNSRTRTIIIMSVHTYGLDAAAEAFSKMKIGKALLHKNYVCLVKCKVENSIVSEPEILDLIKLKI